MARQTARITSSGQYLAGALLQLTGDAQSDMEFGDCDFLTFFIDKKRLAKADFSKVWTHVGD